MRLARVNPFRHQRGIMLLEVLVYAVVASLLVGIAVVLVVRSMNSARGLMKNADQVAAVLSMGEQWRQDIRDASGPPFRLVPDSPSLVIPHGTNHVTYAFVENEVMRKESNDQPFRVVMPDVLTADWNLEERPNVEVWHFDLELESVRKQSTVKPRFSFMAVAREELKP